MPPAHFFLVCLKVVSVSFHSAKRFLRIPALCILIVFTMGPTFLEKYSRKALSQGARSKWDRFKHVDTNVRALTHDTNQQCECCIDVVLGISDNPCQNGGTCNPLRVGYECECRGL